MSLQLWLGIKKSKNISLTLFSARPYNVPTQHCGCTVPPRRTNRCLHLMNCCSVRKPHSFSQAQQVSSDPDILRTTPIEKQISNVKRNKPSSTTGKLAETKGSWTAWSQCFYEPAVVLNRSQPVQQPRIRDKIGQRTGKHLKPRCKREISPMPDSDPLPILHYPPICSVISEKTYDYSQKGGKKFLWSSRRWNSLELFPVEAPVVKYTEKKMTYILPRFISTASFSIWNDELSAGEDSPTYFVNR